MKKTILTLVMIVFVFILSFVFMTTVNNISANSQYNDLVSIEEKNGNETFNVNNKSPGYSVKLTLNTNEPYIRNPWEEIKITIPEEYDVDPADNILNLPDGVLLGEPTYENNVLTYPILSVTNGALIDITVLGEYSPDSEHNKPVEFKVELLNDQNGTDEFGASNAHTATATTSTTLLNPVGFVATIESDPASYKIGETDKIKFTFTYTLTGTEDVDSDIKVRGYINNPSNFESSTGGYTVDEDGSIIWDITQEEIENKTFTRDVYYSFSSEDYDVRTKNSFVISILKDGNEEDTTSKQFYVYPEEKFERPIEGSEVLKSDNSLPDISVGDDVTYIFEDIEFNGSERIDYLSLKEPFADGLIVESIYPGTYKENGVSRGADRLTIVYKDGKDNLIINQPTGSYDVPIEDQENVDAVIIEFFDLEMPFYATTSPRVYTKISEDYSNDVIVNEVEIVVNYEVSGDYPFYCPDGYDQTLVESSEGGHLVTCEQRASNTVSLVDSKVYGYTLVEVDKKKEFHGNLVSGHAMVYGDEYETTYTISNSDKATIDLEVKKIVVDYIYGAKYIDTSLTGANVTVVNDTVSYDGEQTGYTVLGNENEGYLIIELDSPIKIAPGEKIVFTNTYSVDTLKQVNTNTSMDNDIIYVYLNNDPGSIFSVLVDEPMDFDGNSKLDKVITRQDQTIFNPVQNTLDIEVTDEVKTYLPSEIESDERYSDIINNKVMFTNVSPERDGTNIKSAPLIKPSFSLWTENYVSINRDSITVRNSDGRELNFEFTDEVAVYIKVDAIIESGDYITIEYNSHVKQGTRTGYVEQSVLYDHDEYDNYFIRYQRESDVSDAYIYSATSFDYKKEASTTETESGGQIDYKLTLKNNGTTYNDENFKLSDYLPYIGDENGSTSKVYLIKEPVSSYTIHPNYGRYIDYEYILSDGTITNEFPNNPTEIIDVNINFSLGLTPGESLVVDLKVTTSNASNPGDKVVNVGRSQFNINSKNSESYIEEISELKTNSVTTTIKDSDLSTIGDFAYFDANNNKEYDNGDLPLDDINVKLYYQEAPSSKYTLVGQTVTNSGGYYKFTNLEPGNYQVVAESKGNYIVVDENDVLLEDGYYVDTKETNDYIDADFRFIIGGISGALFNDSNRNGIFDENELPYEHPVTVSLIDSNDNVVQTYETDPTLPEAEASRYFFTDIEDGVYKVFASDQYTGYSYYYTFQTGYSTTPNNEQYTTIDYKNPASYVRNFGLALPSHFQGNVFEDFEQEGIMLKQTVEGQEYAQDPLGHVEVYATNTLTGDKRTVRTNELGYFDLDVVPGNYVVSVEKLDNYKFSPKQNDNLADSDGVIDEFRIEEKEYITDLNVGEIPLVSISGNYYEDVNMSSSKDSEDRDLEDRTVEILDGSTVVKSVKTDEEGNYLVKELEPDVEYSVGFVKNDNEVFILPNDTGVEDLGMSTTRNNKFEDVDGSVFIKGKISGKVVLDNNFDDLLDDTDTPLDGYELKIYDTDNNEVSTTTTDKDGYYEFDVESGDYYVAIDYGEYTASSVVTPETENTFKFTDGKSEIFTFVSSTTVMNINAGMYSDEDYYVSIAGKYYEDKDVNDKYDNDDVLLENRSVELYDGTTKVADTTTDSNGEYVFTLLEPNVDYKVVFSKEDDETFNLPAENGESIQTASDYGVKIKDVDASVYKDVTLSGKVVLDNNFDNLLDSNDEAIENFELKLYNESDDSEVATTTTDSNGEYSFTAAPGSYYVGVDYGNYIASEKLEPSTANTFKFENEKSSVYLLNSSEKVTDVNLGLYTNDMQSVTIDGKYYEDVAAEGKYDSADKLLADRTVELYVGDDKVEETTTSSNGTYKFEDLEPNKEYDVQFVKEKDETFSVPNENGLYEVGMVEKGDSYSDIDGAVYSDVTLSGKVVIDKDFSNTLSTDDESLEGYNVQLKDGSGSVVDQTQTDENGEYILTAAPGDYYVSVDYGSYNASERLTPETDDTFKFTDGKTDTFNLVSGEKVEHLNLGLYGDELTYITISGKFYEDMDKSSTYESTDKLLTNRTVELYSGGSKVETTTTDANGNYLFKDLSPKQDYEVKFVKEGSEIFVTPNDEGTIEITNASFAQNFADQDASVYNKVKISGKVVLDLDFDNKLSSSDEPISDFKLELYNSTTRSLEAVTTDSEGNYTFEIDPGTYHVSFEQGDYIISAVGDKDDENAFKFDGNKSYDFTTLSGTVVENVNLGLSTKELQSVTISGNYYEDVNYSMSYDDIDNELAQRTIELYMGSELVASTLTDENGDYLFEGMLPETKYTIKFELNEKEVFIENENFKQLTLPEIGKGGSLTGVDGSMYVPVTISGKVVKDTNKNNILDESDEPVSNFEVDVHNAEDEVVGTISSDAEGNYVVKDLIPSEYHLGVEYGDYTESEMISATEEHAFKFKEGRTMDYTLLSQDELTNLNVGLLADEEEEEAVISQTGNDVRLLLTLIVITLLTTMLYLKNKTRI